MAKPKSSSSRTGSMKRKGTSGAAKNYITRNQALKKLQVPLSDFRRLCILKGIYPREPRNRKKANKGSTAPTTFYYSKDIAYLQHEPVLQKLREHKAFAKKLSRALGRGQEGLAKNLEVRHEGYRLDHIIKERYPTFADSLRDLDDALSLVVLFANLPSSPQVSTAVTANCARLAAEWQLYVMRSKSLRKVFLSVKGIYFQAEVAGQKITWLVPYAFTQRIPPDVDFRIMLTFLELYQTLLGFVFFKLFTDENLVYPIKLDSVKDDAGAGVGALLLEESRGTLTSSLSKEVESSQEAPLRPKVKDVKRQIRAIASTSAAEVEADGAERGEDEPIARSSQAEVDTLAEDMLAPSAEESTDLFSSYVFFLSREVTRPTLEFIIRSFSGRVGWDPILGTGSPYDETDERITHHVVDRPVSANYYISRHPGKRAYIQPQWVVDSVNLKRLLPTEEYAPGKTLPPHLSPFVDDEEMATAGHYVPETARVEGIASNEESMMDDDAEEEQEEDLVPAPGASRLSPPASSDVDDSDVLHAAELEAEGQGKSHSQFSAELAEAQKAPKETTGSTKPKARDELAEIMLSGKQRKLYQKVARSHDRKLEERAKLEAKKRKLQKGSGRSSHS